MEKPISLDLVDYCGKCGKIYHAIHGLFGFSTQKNNAYDPRLHLAPPVSSRTLAKSSWRPKNGSDASVPVQVSDTSKRCSCFILYGTKYNT